MKWWSRWFTKTQAESDEAEARPFATPRAGPVDPLPPLSTIADTHQAFGYKVNWFAVWEATPEAALRSLGVCESFEANWASGMARVYWGAPDDLIGRWVYASPPIDGWTLLVGKGLPNPVDPELGDHATSGKAFDLLFGRLKTAFTEVQFFGSHRVISFVAWARARRGEPDRVFSYADGQVLANQGRRSAEELELGFPDVDGLPVEAAVRRLHALSCQWHERQQALEAAGVPSTEAYMQAKRELGSARLGEQDVVDLAALWSVNPIALEAAHMTPGVGRVAQLPPSIWW